METFYIFIIFSVGLIFIFSKIELKILISFIVMSNCFDLVPVEIFNVKLWDIGLFMFVISTIIASVCWNKECSIKYSQPIYLFFYHLIFALTVISFIYSILVYNYSVVSVIKASRAMICGYSLYYLFTFLFIRNNAFIYKIHSWLYCIVYVLIVLHIFQFITGYRIFYGYHGEENNLLRSIPIFYPLVIIYFFESLLKFFVEKSISTSSLLFIPISVTFFALMFTRGVYIAIFINLILLLIILIYNKRFNFIRVFVLMFFLLFSSLILMLQNNFVYLDTISDRFFSTFSSLQSDIKFDKNNTFDLRMMLLEERLTLVLNKNPLLGFGFIHEDLAQKSVEFKIGTANIHSKKGITFSSADIAWVNILIYTGLVGVLFFVCFIVLFALNIFTKNRLKLNNNIVTQDFFVIRNSYYLAVMASFVLMINGSVWTTNVQIYVFMLSVYSFMIRNHL